MVTQDRDEELALFLEMRRREKEQGASLLTAGSDNDSNTGASAETVPSLRQPLRRTAAENFLYSENEKSDYEWLLTPPGTPQFEKESHRSAMSQLDVPRTGSTALKSRLGNCHEEVGSRPKSSSRQPMLSSGPNSSAVSGTRRPSSSGGLKSTSRPSSSSGSMSTSRPSTPSRRSTTPARTTTSIKATNSRSSTPTSRATLTAARSTAHPSRSATPTSTNRPSRSATPTCTNRPSRSATPTSTTRPLRSATPTRSIPRSSSAQPLPATKSISRSATPTRRPSTPTGPSSASSTGNKPGPSRGTSPTARSRPWNLPEMPGFSLEVPPNLRTTLPDRPLSASRGRPGGASAPSSRSNSIERNGGSSSQSDGRVRRQSCSPSRGRAPIGNANKSLSGVPSSGYGRPKTSRSNDSVSPVAMGTKMVERVVNMRKLAPPRHTDSFSGGSSARKPGSVLDSLGSGRSLSKSSLDMALRHMDIRRSITGHHNLRPLVTKVPASSMYSVRSSTSSRSRAGSVSSSPMATSSSSTSSEPSVSNINILCLDDIQLNDIHLLSHDNDMSPPSPPSLLAKVIT